MQVGVEFLDHYHIFHARLITQPLPSESTYLILKMTIAGLGSEVTLHMSWLGRLHKVLVEFLDI